MLPKNEANLWDLIAATGLVILYILDSNLRLFRPLWPWHLLDDLKKHRAPLCASFQSHWWFQTRVTVQKHSIRVKSSMFLPRVTLKFDGWPWETIEHLIYANSSVVHHSVAICEFKLELQSSPEIPNSGQNRRFFFLCELEMWQMTLKIKRRLSWSISSFVHHFEAMCESQLDLYCVNAKFGSQSAIFCLLWPWNLTDDLWPWKTIWHLSYASYGPVKFGAKFALTSVTLTFHFWPWPFAWTSRLSLVITSENFMMI